MKVDRRWRKRADAAAMKNLCCWCGSQSPTTVATGYDENRSMLVRHVCCDQCMSKVAGDPRLEAKFCAAKAPREVAVFKFMSFAQCKKLANIV